MGAGTTGWASRWAACSLTAAQKQHSGWSLPLHTWPVGSILFKDYHLIFYFWWWLGLLNCVPGGLSLESSTFTGLKIASEPCSFLTVSSLGAGEWAGRG